MKLIRKAKPFTWKHFTKIPDQLQTSLLTDISLNKSIYRWHNILPYDSTRVVITQQSSVNNKSNTGNFSELNSCALRSDYINANHVR